MPNPRKESLRNLFAFISFSNFAVESNLSSVPPSGSDKPKPGKHPLCAEISGYLFQHPCGMLANWKCMKCQKPICNQHSVYQGVQGINETGSNSICIACSKGQKPANDDELDWHDVDFWLTVEVAMFPDDFAEPIWMNRRQRRKLEAKRQQDEPGADENQHDFNDADEGLFVNAEDPAGWEQDMGAS